MLEAATVWVTRGEDETIRKILLDRAEICEDEDGQLDQKDGSYVKNLFWGRNPQQSDQIVIGPHDSSGQKSLKFNYLDRRLLLALSKTYRQLSRMRLFNASGTERKFGNHKSLTIWDPEPFPVLDPLNLTIGIESEFQYALLGPELPSTRQTVGYWSKIALTRNQDLVLDALSVVAKENRRNHNCW